MKNKILLSGLLFLLCLAGFGEEKNDSALAQYLNNAEVKLASKSFNAADRQKGERLLARAKGKDRIRLLYVLARNKRALEEDCYEAMKLLALAILSEEQVRKWGKAENAVRRDALQEWKKAKKKDEDLKEPLPPFSDLPDIKSWDISSSPYSALCCIELAHNLSRFNHVSQSIAILNVLGNKFNDRRRILASEAVAQIYLQHHMYDKSIKLYRVCLEVFDKMYYEGDEYYPHPLRKRLNEGLQNAQKRYEEYQYGPGWVAYRDAEEIRRNQKDYARAYLHYQAIIRDYPDTVYAEASKCYAVHCLMELGKTIHSQAAESSLKQRQREVEKDQIRIKQAEKYEEPAKTVVELKTSLNAKQAALARFRKIPLGSKAVAKARKLASAALRENRYGLYRGEIMLLLAEHTFSQALEPVKAEKQYQQVWDWLQKAEDSDKELDRIFLVPAKAQEVSKAPPSDFSLDKMENAESAELPAGAVVNRRSCSWYLDNLREQCALSLGFLEFWRGRDKQALVWYKKVLKLDEQTAYLNHTQQHNNYTRLKWGAEHGYLYAFPEELKRYKSDKRLRFAVLLADFYFCTERFELAAWVGQRMLDNELGNLNATQDDYPRFLLAACTYWLGDRIKAYEMYRDMSSEKPRTITTDRAALSAGNLCWTLNDGEKLVEGMAILKQLARAPRNNYYVNQARLVYGIRMFVGGNYVEGRKYFASIPPNAKGFRQAAQKYIDAANKYIIKERQGKLKDEAR